MLKQPREAAALAHAARTPRQPYTAPAITPLATWDRLTLAYSIPFNKVTDPQGLFRSTDTN